MRVAAASLPRGSSSWTPDSSNMHLSTPTIHLSGQTARVQCRVHVGGEDREWWIAASSVLAGLLDTGPSPFVPAAVMIASMLGEDLFIDSRVSAVQLEGGRRAMKLFEHWWGWSTPVVTGQPALTSTGDALGDRGSTGLLFTRGIDSTSTLVCSLEGKGPGVTHLVSIDGLEPNHSPLVAAQVRRDTESAAASVGLPFIGLSTNLRSEVDRFAGWERTHGAVLLGTALVLSPLLGRMVITPTLSDRQPIRHGSTPELDGCWATERTAVITADPSLTRTGRARIVVRRPALARTLKVCWQADVRGNCGRCVKCLMTMTALASVAAPNPSEAFDAPLSLEAIRSLTPAPAGALPEVIADIPADMVDLRDAWRDFQARTANGTDRRGLAGFDPAQRWRRAGGHLDHDTPIGWGRGAIEMHLERERQHALCRRPASLDRPLGWCVAERVDSVAARLAGLLNESWERGAVLLVDRDAVGPSPAAVSLLLTQAAVRCWWSDAERLEGVQLFEALEHGCVPIQVMRDDRAAAARSHLDRRYHCLILAESMIEDGRPSDDALRQMWSSAVQLVVSGSLEHDVASVGT